MSPYAIETSGLRLRLNGVGVLNGVDLALERGRITALVGPNGAGKTTLFNTIAGDLAPDMGEVRLDGRPVTGAAPWQLARAGVGRLFQEVRVFDDLSSIENVVLALLQLPERRSRWMPVGQTRWNRLRDEAMGWIESVGVTGELEQPAGRLSFGNRKLLALARLLAGRFSVLLLDEPTAGVSPDIVVRIVATLRDLRVSTGMTIAVIEHDYEFVAAIADRVCVLSEGRVLDFGETSTVLGNKRNREILVGL
jgi:branched-chain amino acid transport system ATP-binding protein